MEQNQNYDTGLQSLITIATFYGIHADIENIQHEFMAGKEKANIDDICRISKKIGLKNKCVKTDIYGLSKIALPAILQQSDGTFFIIAKVEGDKALVLYPFDTSPKAVELAILNNKWNGKVLLFIPRDFKNSERNFGFRWFIPTILKYKQALMEIILASLCIQILSICSPLVTQSVIDKVLVHNSRSTLDVLIIALVVMLIFETVLSLARNYLLTHTTSKIDVILSSRLFEHLFRLPLRYFEKRRTGDTVARVRELENIRRFLTGVPLTTILDCMFLVIYIVLLAFYSIKLTMVTLGSLPLLIVITAAVTPLLRSHIDEQLNSSAELQSYLVETVTGVQTIKSFAIEPTVKDKWGKLLANYVVAGFRTTMLSGNASAIARFIQRGCDIAILWYGARLVMDGNMTVGELVAFRMISGRVSEPIMRLVQLWNEFQQANISVKRIGDIFNSREEQDKSSSNMRMPKIKGYIQFDKVSFRYEVDGPEIIRDMSFKIPANTIVGIVGRSGSGKSTISKLVQRLYIPERGCIRIDGVDISTADPVWLRRQIGVVLQENFLFNATIRENIALHNPAASMDQIVGVAKIAGAHDFILELPNGYDTVVGEKGTGLSGGQKQRIAIARALLCDPKILIFDEATSALDYESESIIQKNLKEICKGRTVLIIAHRLSTLRDADAIMVVEKGRIAEYGPKQKLIEAKGLFWHLLRQQSQI